MQKERQLEKCQKTCDGVSCKDNEEKRFHGGFKNNRASVKKVGDEWKVQIRT